MPRWSIVASVGASVAALTLQTTVAYAPAGTGFGVTGELPGTRSQLTAGPEMYIPQPGHDIDVTPVRLLISRIHLEADIESRGLDASRNLDTAQDIHNVAWYDRGPAPGQPGNALINGHVSWWTGDAVFTHLWQVRVGDRLQVVRADGVTVWFAVTARRIVSAGARIASLFAPSSNATLTLITCTGVWDPFTMSDTQRLLVSAALAQE